MKSKRGTGSTTVCLCLSALLGFGLLAACGQGAQADQIKRRARSLAEENNARQGVPPQNQPPAARPAQPQPVVAPKPVAPATPEQKGLSSIRAGLGVLAATNSPESPKHFSKTLLASARGTGKPTGAAVDQLAEDTAAALAGGKFSTTQLDRLAQNFDGAVNASGMTAIQSGAIGDDVRSVLEKAGVNSARATLVAGDLKRVIAEVQIKPAR